MADKTLPENELRAFFSLLQDEDEKIAPVLRMQLRQIMDTQPVTVQSLISMEFPQLRKTLDSIVEDSRWETIGESLKILAENGENPDLEEGLFQISKFAYPKADKCEISLHLDAIAADVRQDIVSCPANDAGLLRCNLTIGKDAKKPQEASVPTDGFITDILDIIDKLNNTLFAKHGFRGNERNYYDPENTFLFSVLKKRQGSPISLSSIYILVAKRLGLPISGIGLPGHFIVQAKTPEGRIYLDPFRNGRRLTSTDCRMMALRQNIEWDAVYLTPVNMRYILERTLVNLMNSYGKAGDERRAEWLKKYLAVFENPG